MKKTKFRGFTLVELLAVIVILAIILVIAVPQIMKTIESARLGSFKSTAKLLLSQAEKQYLVDQTLNVNGEENEDTTYQGTGNGDTECGKLAKLGSDYSACKITVNKSTGVATLVTLTGTGKFANYSCTNTTLSNVDSTCNKSGSSSGSSETTDTVAFVVSNTEMKIGGTIPTGVNVRNNATAAMADWAAMTGVANDTKPFYLKHTLNESNEITESYVCFEKNNTQYCIKGGDEGAAFLSNAKIIYDAFEGTGCNGDDNLPATYDSSYNPNPTYNFVCSESGVGAFASTVNSSGGYVSAFGGDYSCGVSSDGSSDCRDL